LPFGRQIESTIQTPAPQASAATAIRALRGNLRSPTTCYFNLLEFLAAVITPWIDILNDRLTAGDCAISMTDSTTAEGWMQKSNFVESNESPVQAAVRVQAARKYATIFMDADVKG
jgi:hypothetical protein